MKSELKKEEIYFLARVKKIEVQYLERLKDILDPKQVRSILIRYEYRQRISDAKSAKIKVSKSAITTLLMTKYKVSRSYIESILYAQSKWRKRVKECTLCGAETSYYRWSKYNGLCKECVDNKWERFYDD